MFERSDSSAGFMMPLSPLIFWVPSLLALRQATLSRLSSMPSKSENSKLQLEFSEEELFG